MESWFDPLLRFADSAWSYLLVSVAAFLDVLIPIVPSETALITCGVFATVGGTPNVFLLIALGALGAFAGDNTAYAIGRWAEPFATRRLLSGDRGRKARAQAERWLGDWGGAFIIIGRFIPGGRTAVAVTSGLIRYPWPKFRGFTAIGALTWATYSTMLGYWGGAAFKDDPLKGVIAGLVAAAVVTVLVEVVRRVLSARRRRKRVRARQES
ncbi:DedA family protein [Yinghuangia sp. ASG 101]|uniref:DedA family protein n=1 Tax=Yinghuangia sp. ASG 101 TaxID=2896848 RepID=UPI001E33921F|nr:DedA family protein [Yinghuangia sp. ASG 101]UGQ10362.1 DedA family protein [Yinghuangia sp. ASG 101]